MKEEYKKKTLQFKHVTELVNHVTGEISQTENKSIFQIDKEPDYVKLYVRDIIRLNDLAPSQGHVLMAMLQSMGYNNIIPAYASIKKIMCRDLGISMNTLNKAIDHLYKKNILIRIDRGMYVADPDLFGRGTWGDIKEIRMMITYTKEGKKVIKSDVDKEQLRLF
jgi:hypothetical protein